MPDKYLTTTQAAKICCVTRFTIANWAKAGKLKSSKTVGGHRRILEKDLRNFIKKNRMPGFNQNNQGDSNDRECSQAGREGKIKKGNGREAVSRVHAVEADYQIPRCWEFRFQDPSKHNCANCLVLKEGANKCFLIAKMFGPEKKQCEYECFNCEYFMRYYPVKKNVLTGVKKRQVNRVGNRINGKEEDAPEFVKKGLYASGKYVASIRRVLVKKIKKR